MSLKISLLFGLCLIAALSSGERARFDNYRVYKVVPSDKNELDTLIGLENSSDSIIFMEGIRGIGQDSVAVVAPHKVPDFLQILGASEIEYELISDNYQGLLEAEDDDVQIAGRAAAYDWTSYHTLDSTYKWLESLPADFPGVVTLIEGGKTYERRSIMGVKISFGSGTKPGIFLEAGIHAREWIAPATATYIINELLNSKDANVRRIAENYTWYIFPHANPDGYVYTHTTNRTWRKTRSLYKNCYGTDPNRNWNSAWNTVGASSNACSDTFAGSAPFSEIETKTLSDYIASLKGRLNLYISFHAYSQYLLYPYGYTKTLPKNANDYRTVFNAAVSAMSKRYGTKYTGGNIYDAIYPAAGASVDWAYDVVGIGMSFCYELRPASNNAAVGFKLPAAQIIPTGQETIESVIAMIDSVNSLGYMK